MAFSPREYRAIQYIANKNHWKLTLCTAPVVYYVGPDGNTIQKLISDVVAEYDQGKREDLREAKRVKPIARRFS